MNWILIYRGPKTEYIDYVDGGKRYVSGWPEIVDEETKIRLTEETRNQIYPDSWEAQPEGQSAEAITQALEPPSITSDETVSQPDVQTAPEGNAEGV